MKFLDSPAIASCIASVRIGRASTVVCSPAHDFAWFYFSPWLSNNGFAELMDQPVDLETQDQAQKLGVGPAPCRRAQGTPRTAPARLSIIQPSIK